MVLGRNMPKKRPVKNVPMRCFKVILIPCPFNRISHRRMLQNMPVALIIIAMRIQTQKVEKSIEVISFQRSSKETGINWR